MKKVPAASKLNKSFYLQDSSVIARKLLGKILVLKTGSVSSILAGKIVETEAYLGVTDAASHSYKGKVTPRNKIMYEEGGVIYIYLIYGMYFCFNLVWFEWHQYVYKKDVPQAVFIRALQPLEGIDIMKKNNEKAKSIENLTNGPCRWTASFGIDKSLLGEKIYSNRIYILSTGDIQSKHILKAKRIGVDYAKESREWLLRFYIKDNPFVSRK